MTILEAVTRDLELDIEAPETESVFKALGNAQRLRMLRLLGEHAFTVTQIAKALSLPLSTANQHLRVLEDAGLIRTDLRPATRGTEKVCSAVYKKVVCDLIHRVEAAERAVEIAMPIGSYSDFEISRPCGIASRDGLIGLQGDPEAFLEPERSAAQLLWFASGYVEYRFPKRLPPQATLESLYLSVEICSEAFNYDEDWPSDITVWINGVDIGSWTSPGDFGATRGLLNPDWWSSQNTQHGVLKSWQVNLEGSYIDGVRISNATLADLDVERRPYIAARIGNKPDAEHVGGVNLFGRGFGNFPQDLVLRLVYGRS